MRKFALLLALLLAGCVQDTTFKLPTTGATVSCSGIMPDINLWSGYQLCKEAAISEGYLRVP